MRRRISTLTATACFVLIAVAGCGGPGAPPALEAETSPADAKADVDDHEDAASEVEATQQAKKRASNYKPPFPQRSELFVPPSTGKRVARRKSGDMEESVELLGFVQIDKPHAVLSIDGVVTPVALGNEKNGVQVISIQPPVAVLQRGRSRWPARLE